MIKHLLLGSAFALCLLSSCDKQLVERVDLIPLPEEVTISKGHFPLNQLHFVSAPEKWIPTVQLFCTDVKHIAKIELGTEPKSSLVLQQDLSLGEEAYQISVTKQKIVIKAADIKGVNHAFSSLHQLMLGAVNGAIPVVTIEDKPLYGYRGFMLDCSRHFWTVKELKETIDHLAFFKMNALHLHLTDNQGWRMAMDKYPNLVKAGTYYYDFPEMSGKYYSKEDLKEIVQYAGIRGIEIIPEIDLPGHALALLAAMPELSCKGGVFETYPEERPWEKRKRANETMICVGNPQSLVFAEDVIDALIEIFPSKYIHLGGDEVPTAIWKDCPRCKSLYKKMGMKDWGEIQDYFTKKMSDMIRDKGKVMVGWDEINDRGVATTDNVLTVWRNDGIEAQKKALERGIPVIMCPQHGCYFDWGYAGNSTRKAYEWNPVAGVSSTQQKLILGGQAALWTERVATQDRVEWMIFPRICALAEVFWTEPSLRNWDDFYQRITTFYPYMEKLGINYYEDDALNEKEFVPSDEKPALVRNARIETNIPNNNPYHAEYAFDGKTNSFYWGGTSVGPQHFFTVILGEPMKVNEVKVITGDSKDYITKADLLVSEDGKRFEKVASFDDLGQAEAQLNAKTIVAVKIQITEQHTCWPIIKEVILK